MKMSDHTIMVRFLTQWKSQNETELKKHKKDDKIKYVYLKIPA